FVVRFAATNFQACHSANHALDSFDARRACRNQATLLGDNQTKRATQAGSNTLNHHKRLVVLGEYCERCVSECPSRHAELTQEQKAVAKEAECFYSTRHLHGGVDDQPPVAVVNSYIRQGSMEGSFHYVLQAICKD